MKQYSIAVFSSLSNYGQAVVPVTGAKEVGHVTTDAGNGNSNDHSVWADAKFLTVYTAPTLFMQEPVDSRVEESTS